MQNSVKKLRPKANKLLSYSANWKRANRDLNKELGEQIQTLYEKESFPKAIALFFEMPTFKKVLKNLSGGSLWKDVYVFTDEDHHPPEEIQKVQNITLAFQKLCSISHYPNYPDDPIARAKLLTEDLEDYFFVLIKLKSFKGKAAERVKAHLIENVKDFLKQLKKTFKQNKPLFSNIQAEEFIKELQVLKNVTHKHLEITHKLLSILHLCAKDEEGNVNICRKVLNQMHSEIEFVFDAITKNAPFFLPYALRKSIHEQLNSSKNSEQLHSCLKDLFNTGKYEIIETKQESHLQNVKEACYSLHILENSLDLSIKKGNLPDQLIHYYNNYYLPTKAPLAEIELYNSQVGYFLAGFYETQITYLLELLNNPPSEVQAPDVATISGEIISFLETYVKIKPELLQIDITGAFTNVHIKELSIDDAKTYIKNTLSFFLPEQSEEVFTSLEKQSKAILTPLLSIYKKMDPKSYPAIILKEKIKGLYLLDIPSFQLGFHLFGEIISTLLILASFSGQNVLEIAEPFLCDIYKYPIFSILLNTKRSNLPKILIKLQMI